jgi:hypothetical protein
VAETQRKAALDAGFVVHLAQKKVMGGIAQAHLLFGIRAWTEGLVATSFLNDMAASIVLI